MHVQGKFVHPITIQQSIEQNLEKEEYSPEKDFFQCRYIQVIQGGRHTLILRKRMKTEKSMHKNNDLNFWGKNTRTYQPLLASLSLNLCQIQEFHFEAV